MADAVARPRVFISSVIHEFRDLRYALKYWLEEMGFEVQLSEHNDFDRKPDDGTFEACFKNIRECEYYLLLIGGTKGSTYDQENDLTVTRQEYRTAMRSWEKSGKPQPVMAIRGETKVALRERETAKTPDYASSRYLKDPKFVRDFVSEVQKEAQAEKAKKGKAKYPASNWLAEFTTFRELTDLLRSTLSISGPLQEQAVLENLTHELKRNLRLGLMNLERTMMPKASILDAVRNEIVLTTENYLQDQYSLTHDQLKKFMLYHPTDADALVTAALDEAIRSGVLLDYDIDEKQLRPSKILAALYRLRDEIAVFRRRYAVFFQDYKQIGAAWFQVKDSGGSAGVPPLSLLTVLGTNDADANVFDLMLAILRHRYGHTAEIEFRTRARSPVEGEDVKMESEVVSDEDLEAALQKDSIQLRLGQKADEETQKALAAGEALLISKIGRELYEKYQRRIKEKIGEKPPETDEDITSIVSEAVEEVLRPPEEEP